MTRSDEPFVADPLHGEVVLLLGDRDRRHVAAQLARRKEREAAPSGADLEHPHAGSEAGSLGDDPVLVALSVIERLIGRGEDRARVGQRLVQEEAIEVVSQVVVGRDIATRVRPGVPPRSMRDDARNGRRHSKKPSRDAERFTIQRADHQRRNEVRTAPMTVRVCLANARLTTDNGLPECAPVVHANLGARAGNRSSIGPAGGVGELEREFADADPSTQFLDDPFCGPSGEVVGANARGAARISRGAARFNAHRPCSASRPGAP